MARRSTRVRFSKSAFGSKLKRVTRGGISGSAKKPIRQGVPTAEIGRKAEEKVCRALGYKCIRTIRHAACSDMDHAGVDITAFYKGHVFYIQVKAGSQVQGAKSLSDYEKLGIILIRRVKGKSLTKIADELIEQFEAKLGGTVDGGN